MPSLVGPMLELTLLPVPELRKATLPVFFELMEAEQVVRGTFKQVSTELCTSPESQTGDAFTMVTRISVTAN